MDGHTGIIAVSGAGGEGQDMVAALWMNPGLDQGILQQLIKSHSHIREPPVFFFSSQVSSVVVSVVFLVVMVLSLFSASVCQFWPFLRQFLLYPLLLRPDRPPESSEISLPGSGRCRLISCLSSTVKIKYLLY